VESPLRKVAPLLAALAFSSLACPDTIGQLCPTGTSTAGQFTVTLTLQHPPDTCAITQDADGGALDGSLGAESQKFGATLCSGLAGDGGALVYLAVLNHGTRQSPLGADAGFMFSSSSTSVLGTACNCALDINESINGNLYGPDGGVSPDADGGLANVVAIGGTLVDRVAPSSDAGGCWCNVPCALSYSLSGQK